MSKVKRDEILGILDGYDKEELTIATLGSHTSMHILHGAKKRVSELLLSVKRDVKYHISASGLLMNS